MRKSYVQEIEELRATNRRAKWRAQQAAFRERSRTTKAPAPRTIHSLAWRMLVEHDADRTGFGRTVVARLVDAGYDEAESTRVVGAMLKAS